MGDSFESLQNQLDGKLMEVGAIKKVELPATTFEASMRWLQLIGIRHYTFFPDLEGIKLDFEERRIAQIQAAAQLQQGSSEQRCRTRL